MRVASADPEATEERMVLLRFIRNTFDSPGSPRANVLFSTIQLDGIGYGLIVAVSAASAFMYLTTRVQFDQGSYRLYSPGVTYWRRQRRLMNALDKKKIFYGRHPALGWIRIAPNEN